MNPMLNTAGTTAADIPEFPMPRPPRCPFDPPQELRSLQEEGALARVRLWDGSTPWVVTRHAEQKALSTDPRVSADSDTPGYPRTTDGGEGAKFSFVHLDDPEHARLRRMVSGAFTKSSGSRRCARPCRRWSTDSSTTCWQAPGRRPAAQLWSG
ncbi:hypothetical protein OHU45_35555 [Streptomyces tubercidicus]|uniref:hypothetical protein n=1 Tax=Streptomyces tubercidicus TaxID=47759 RepID=UPI003757D9DA